MARLAASFTTAAGRRNRLPAASDGVPGGYGQAAFRDNPHAAGPSFGGLGSGSGPSLGIRPLGFFLQGEKAPWNEGPA